MADYIDATVPADEDLASGMAVAVRETRAAMNTIIDDAQGIVDSVSEVATDIATDVATTIATQIAADTTVSTVNAVLAALSDNINTLNTTVGDQGSSIQILSETDADYALRIETLETTDTDHESRIVTVESTTGDQASRLTVLEATVNSLGIPDYAADTPYELNQLVTYAGTVYKCIQAYTPPPNILPTDVLYWEVSDITASLQALVTEEQLARIAADEAIALTIETVETTVDGHTTSIGTIVESVDGINGRWGVKINADGYGVGFALIANAAKDNTPAASTLLFQVDKFQIVAAGVSAVTPFIYDAILGQFRVDNAYIKQLTADSIDTDTLIVGDNITMGPNAILSWNQVGDKPTIPTNTNQLTDGANLGITATWANVSGTGKPANDANKTYLDANGVLQGVSSGAGTAVANSLLTTAINSAAATAVWANVSSKPELVLGNGLTTLGSNFVYSGTVTTEQLVAATALIGSALIASGAITEAKIDTAAITNAKLGTASISTLKVQDQAITFPTAAYRYTHQAGSYVDRTTSYVISTASINMTNTGAPVIIMASMSVSCNLVSDGGTRPVVVVEIVLDSTVLSSVNLVPTGMASEDVVLSSAGASRVVMPTPSAGAHNYYLRVRYFGMNGSGSNGQDLISIESADIVCLEAKK